MEAARLIVVDDEEDNARAAIESGMLALRHVSAASPASELERRLRDYRVLA